MIGSAITDRAGEILQDDPPITWTNTQRLAWLNDGLIALIYERPDANLQRRIQKLAYGTHQEITGSRLHEITRNMGSGGTVPGRAIRVCLLTDKNHFDPLWHNATPSNEVREYFYDPLNEKRFYVSPPVSQTEDVYVELMQFEVPAVLTTLDDLVTVDDIWAPALIEWVCFRATQRDSEETPGLGRANTHFQTFYSMLGKKATIDYLISAGAKA